MCLYLQDSSTSSRLAAVNGLVALVGSESTASQVCLGLLTECYFFFCFLLLLLLFLFFGKVAQKSYM